MENCRWCALVVKCKGLAAGYYLPLVTVGRTFVMVCSVLILLDILFLGYVRYISANSFGCLSGELR